MAEKTPTWRVTAQVETIDVGPSGEFVPGVRVTFRTASGATGSVFVPAGDYRVDRVRELIDERAATIEEIARLEG